jgi:flagellar biosynthesis GTPase FlhF
MNSQNPAIPNILEQIRQRHAALDHPSPSQEARRPHLAVFQPASSVAYGRLAAYLREQGVLTEVSDELLENVHGLQVSAGSLEEELGLAEAVLKQRWRSGRHSQGAGETHIFVGPHGSGKTTVLCKWLAQTVLLGSQSARVFRLDGNAANTAESLSVYCEVLGVPVSRSLPADEGVEPVDVTFIDLPGANLDDPSALEELRRKCAAFPGAQVHLVLNGAYETALLLAQVNAISALPVTDIIVAHLDEELRWGKLLNLLWRTDLPLAWFAAGQNVPGGLLEAKPGHLLPRMRSYKSHASVLSNAA